MRDVCAVCMVLGTTLEGLERLNSFLHICVRTVLGITNERQWEECISSAAVKEQWGDVETIETKLMRRRLEWLGHLARMQNHRCLFRWLPQTRPSGGPRRRWRDLAKKDLKAMQVGEDWYSVAQDRGELEEECMESALSRAPRSTT